MTAFGQNLPFATVFPHSGQTMLPSGAATIFPPHSRQNFALTGRVAPHFGHTVFEESDKLFLPAASPKTPSICPSAIPAIFIPAIIPTISDAGEPPARAAQMNPYCQVPRQMLFEHRLERSLFWLCPAPALPELPQSPLGG